MIGMVLGGRYEILEEVGSGGMAVVYKARCNLLNRFVAVKVLRKEYANDEEFLARFNIESQAAARLSHPNIVSVYDVGKEDDINYIVMELVDGKTLKDYIVSNGILSWREASGFSIQILSALEHAHKNGIIHRDIKPHNILITPDRILKVTDFGIARASTANTLTLSGNTLGSVHYLSPEQARGGYTDARSDIYSVGIVMYEMLAGRLPFDGESPIAIAIMQIQNAPPPLKDFNVSVPLALDAIVMKAIKKEQDARYQTASDMINDIRKAMQQPAAEIEQKEDLSANTKKMKAVDVPLPDPEPEEEEPSILEVEPVDYVPRTKGAQEKANPLTQMSKETGRDMQVEQEDSKGTGKRKTAIAMGVVVSVLIAAIVGFAMWLLLFNNQPTLEVPSLVGMNYNEAIEKYKNTPFEIKMKQKGNDVTKEKDVILSQDPGAGTNFKRDKVQIDVIVNVGPQTFTLESYRGQDERVVTPKLTELGAKVVVEKKKDSNVAQGFIIDTVPIAGSLIKSGDTVTLYISEGGSAMTTVPKLVGLKLADAKRKLQESSLTLGTVNYKDSADPYETVQIQSISAGDTVETYTQIDLLISNGKNTTESPTATTTTTSTPSPTTAEKSKSVTIQVPQSKESTLVKVTSDGKTIHEKRHSKDEVTFTVDVKGTGSVSIEIFYDGVSQGTIIQKL